jgi:hypothetical protein
LEQCARGRQRRRRSGYRRPLYLSAPEARALAVLSVTSPFALNGASRTKADNVERALFARLGRFLHAF